ncbi:FAD-dependent oxidoreductase [Dietzia sp. NCCP-2495]|uniref:FAD-dependent oxidoreductase n=1 Tax=Dietzia sp. NCCP-2495 TaxID=2934675 RepID=UPI00223192E7|nr:FAD-dependent oxidoreductase [Dietzia sp. NCCP-2495]
MADASAAGAARPGAPRRVVIVGAGMAAARLAEELRAGQPDSAALEVTVLGAEPDEPYNRIMLSHAVAEGGANAGGATAGGAAMSAVARLKPTGWWERSAVELRTSAQVIAIDRASREVMLADGSRIAYDHLVLATGAQPRIPPIAGIRVERAESVGPDGAALAPGAFTLRDAADGRALTAHLAATPGPVAVVGGGFIGLEVACALAAAGREVTVVHPRDRPMNSVLDAGAGAVLVRALAALGIRVRTRVRATVWDGRGLVLDDDDVVVASTVVLTAGQAARTDLARDAGLEVGDGIVVDDELATSDPAISAIGDCAEHRGSVGGVVAPAWEQATVLAARLTGDDPGARYVGATQVTRLKAFGLDVVALGELALGELAGGDVGGVGAGRAAECDCCRVESTTISEPARGRYARVDVAGGKVVGAVLVGHPEPVGTLTQLYESALPVPDDVVSVILGRAEAVSAATPATMPAAAVVCRCNGVSKSDLVAAWGDGARDQAGLAERTRAGTGCGGCASAVEGICGWLRDAS